MSPGRHHVDHGPALPPYNSSGVDLVGKSRMAIYSLGDKQPLLSDPVWIADSATVIGAVVMQANASVFYGAVVRADNDVITIGAGSNVQDNAVLHTDPDIQLTLGSHVTVGHQAMLHGCHIGDGSLIGIGAIILNNAVIGKHCLVGANALVPEGRKFPERSLILGSPAKLVRELGDDEVQQLLRIAENYVVQWKRHSAQLVRM